MKQASADWNQPSDEFIDGVIKAYQSLQLYTKHGDGGWGAVKNLM